MADTNDALDRIRRSARLTHAELWLRCFALGATFSGFQLEAFLYGALRPGGHDYDVIAQALNERFMELGDNRRVDYGDDEPDTDEPDTDAPGVADAGR